MDQVMMAISGRFTWIPLYLLLVILIYWNYKNKTWLIILFAVLAIIISDQVANLIKNEVMRLRPSHTPGVMELLHFYKNSNGNEYMGGLYGFVSNHAANSACLATFLSLLFRRMYIAWGLIIWAFLLSYSRVYLGVHYPSDVLCGVILGILIGYFIYKGYEFACKRLLSMQ